MALARRPNFPSALKCKVVEDSYQPGTSVSMPAREHGINASMVFVGGSNTNSSSGQLEAMIDQLQLSLEGLRGVGRTLTQEMRLLDFYATARGMAIIRASL